MHTRWLHPAVFAIFTIFPTQTLAGPVSQAVLRASPLANTSSDVGSWRSPHSVSQIDAWALNPTGDAAVIRTETRDTAGVLSSYDLHILAINAQYTIPTVHYGSTHHKALYTFLSDTEFVTLAPKASGDWELSAQHLNYTVSPGAFPPSASEPLVVGNIELAHDPTRIVWSAQRQRLSILEGETGEITVVKLDAHRSVWSIASRENPLQGLGLIVKDIVASPSQLAFSAYKQDAIQSFDDSIIYVFDYARPGGLRQISSLTHHAASSPAFGPNGELAWLERDDSVNSNSRRTPWISKNGALWNIPLLNFDLDPVQILFSKDGRSLNLLAEDGPTQSLYHIWTPEPNSPPFRVTRIPSPGVIHEAIHVGITPLNHSHLIALYSDVESFKEIYVISHSPGEDPAGNYEQIRLTNFTGQ